MNIYVPEEIKTLIGGKEYTRNKIGMSGSAVLMFDEYVLKIEERTSETDNVKQAVTWLNGRLPTPKIIAYVEEGAKAYTLMSRVPGKMLCDAEYMNEPERLVHLAAECLKMLWSIEIEGCPCDSRLEKRLKAARYNVEHRLVDVENTEPETFGPNGFSDPEDLLRWLESHRPPEDLVFTHGDFCLPNLFAVGDHISGLIDLGKMGVADRWQDIAICMRSLSDNFTGKYHGETKYPEYRPEMLLDELKIELDEEKLRYYILLDELF